MTTKILHVRRRGLDDSRGQDHYGGVTIAYRWNRGDTFIDVATAHCSDQDIFIKKVGAAIALSHLSLGCFVRLPFKRQNKSSGVTPTHLVRQLFDPVYQICEVSDACEW